MSEFKIKVNVELDTNDIESKLNALGKEFDLEVKLDMGKITSQINEIKAAFKDAFKIDSKFANDLKTIANKLKQVNGSLDDSSSGKNSKSVNSLMQQYKELYKLREKLQKQMASGKLGDDSIERTSEQVAKLTKQMSALKNSMSDSQKAGIELFDAKQSTKSLVDMNNYLNKIETQASSLGTKLNSISFNNVDDSKIKSIGERLEEIQRKAREGIDLEFDDVGNILSDLNRISSEIKNLEKVENLASAFEKISSSVAEAGGDVEKFASELKSLEGIVSSLDGSFDKAFSNANSELKSMQSNVRNATRAFGDSSNGFLGSWDDFRGNFAQFTLAEVAGEFIADGIRTMARGFKDTIVETDSAIVDLNKVYERGLSGDNLKSYLGTFTEVAKATGKSSIDVIQGTTKAIQSGISDLDQAITYATKASMLSNVGDIDQGQADTMLASIMSAYGGIENSIRPVREQITGMGKDYDTLTKFIDLANYAGNNFAISTADVGAALQNSAAALQTNGVSMEQSVAMVTAMNEIVQDASKSGNALKTMSANFSGLTTSAKDGSIQLTKAGKTLKEIAGIEVWNQQTGEVKDMFTVVDELHSKWDGLSEAQRIALGSAVAGKTQLNTFNALMSNWETAKQLVDEYNQGLTIGSAEKENLRYLDSINGKWNVIKENMKGVANTLVSSDMAKGFLDSVIGVTDAFNKSVKLTTSTMEHSFKGTLDDIFGNTFYKGLEKFNSTSLFSEMFGDWGSQFNKLGTAMSTVLGKGLETAFSKMTSFGKALEPIMKILGLSDKLGEDSKLDNSIDERKQNINTIQSEINSLKNQKASLDEVMESYEKLSNNTKRSAKENEELIQIREQLAQTNPDMVAGYDDDGNVILKNAKLYNAELERQIKLKQQSQRLEENTLANEAYERRLNQEKEYGELMEKNNKASLAYESDKKQGLFGIGSETTEEYFKRLKEGNEQIAKQNAETYKESLEAYQQYVADEKAIQEKHINQMESSNAFKKMADEQKESILGLMQSLDWSGLSLTEGSNITRQLEQLGDKVVSTTEQMGEHSKAINQLETDYSNNNKTLTEYADGLGKIYESANKLDVESFGNLQSEIQGYIDATGDLEGANRMMDGLAESLYKVTKIPKNTWKDLLVMDPAPIDASNQALQRFLKTYNTSVDKMGKDLTTDKLVSQFDTLQTSLSQLTNDVISGGTIDAEYLLEMKINQPEPIQNLIDEIVKDGVDKETELPVLVNAMIDILNTGEITDDTIGQIADLFGMTPQEVKMMLKVNTEVVGMEDLESEIASWNSLTSEEKELLLRQVSEGGDEIKISKEEWDSLSEGEKIQKLRQLLEENGDVDGASEKFENAPEGDKNQTLNQSVNGEGEVERASEAIEGLPDSKDTTISITGDNIGVTSKIKEDLEGIPKKTTTEVEVKATGEASSGGSIKDKIKKLLGFGEGSQKVTVDAEIDVKPTVTSGLSLKDKIKNLLGFGGKGTSETVTVDAKVGNVDTSALSNVQSKDIEVEARVGKVDTSSISSINAPTIEVKANVGSALSQVNSIKSAMNGIQSKSVTINASGNALGQINAIKSALAGLQSKSIAINVAVSGTAQVNALKSAIASLQGKSVSVNATTGGIGQVNALTSAIAKVQSKTVSVTARVTGTSQVNALTSAINRVKSKSVSISAKVSGTGAVQSLASAIASVKSKSATVSVTRKVTTVQSSVPTKRSITPMLANTSLSSIPVSMSAPVTTSANTTPMVTASDTPSVSVTAKASPMTNVDLNNLMGEFDLDIDSFKALREELERISNVYEIIQERAEGAFGNEKLTYLRKQLSLLSEQQAVQEELLNSEREQNRELNQWLGKKGFQIDDEGNINNYQQYLTEWEEHVKSLKDRYDQLNDVSGDNKNEDAINSARKAYEKANEELESIKDHLEAYFETNNRLLPEAKKKMEEYANQIKEVKAAIREVENRKITIQIDDISGQISHLESRLDMTDSSTNRIKNMEEQNALYERQQYLLSQLIDQMTAQRYSVEKGSEEHAELTSSIHEANEEWWKLEKAIKDNKMEILEQSTRKARHEIDYLASQIDRLDAKMESYSGKQKLELMDKQIVLYEQQLKATQDLEKELRSQLATLHKHSEEYEEMELTIAELVTQEWELANSIREALTSKLEIVKDIEDEITGIYEKEYERREKEIEDFHDKQIEMLEKEKDAYNEMRSEQEYKKSVNEQIEEIAKLNQQIETAKRDTTIGGAKRLKELTEELREAQEELEEMTQDKIDSDFENNIDKEIERLEQQEESLLKKLEEKFTEENIGKMVAQAMSSGVIEINGEIKSLQDAMIESINSSAEGYSVMAQVVKNELVSNLGIALETVRELDSVYSGLKLQDFGTPNVNINAVATPTSGTSTKNITVGDTNITIQGSVDNATLEEIEQLIKDSQNEMLQRIAQDL